MLGSVGWGSIGVVPPVATFLPLEAAVETAVCRDAFLGGAISLERLFEESFSTSVWRKGRKL